MQKNKIQKKKKFFKKEIKNKEKNKKKPSQFQF